MTDLIGLHAPENVSVGVRLGVDRRKHERRRQHRQEQGRRRGDRRRGALHGLLGALLTFSAHVQGMRVGPQAAPAGRVSVRIDDIRAVPPQRAYEGVILEAALTYGVDADLIRAVIQTESAFDPNAVSRAGAQGLMQLMPALSKWSGVADPFDPRQNVMAGARYLRALLDRFDGSVRLATASYNAGPTAVARYNGVPPYKETQHYVKKIATLLAQADEATTTD